MTQTDIFVRHERGFGNAKISSLDDTNLLLLGLKTATQDEEVAANGTGNSAPMGKVKAAMDAVNLRFPSESAVLGSISRTKPTPQLLVGVLAVLLITYLFYCYCLRRICVNAGIEPGGLVWVPVLQMFPLLRAARMPTWWFVVFLIPVLNILAHILWCARIVRACGKGGLATLFLILPVTNVLAFLYLAFAGGNEAPPEKGMKPEDLPGLAGA
jgi:RsiW-degrading membrane proteinase PrsW (M82 family)